MSSASTPDPSPQTRGGWALFLVYLVAYGAFVVTNAFWPQAMAWQPLPGINLAVASGVGLIGLTLAIACIYSWLRRKKNSSDLSTPSLPS